MKRDIKVGVSPLLVITRILILVGVLMVYVCFALSFMDLKSEEKEEGYLVIEQSITLNVGEV